MHAVAPSDASLLPGTRRLVDDLGAARQALAEGDVGLAMGHAEGALRVARDCEDGATDFIMSVSASLLDNVFSARVGPWEARLKLSCRQSGDRMLSPQLAFLLSRIEDGMTVEEAIGGSGLRTRDAIRLLAHLLEHGWVERA